MVNQVTGHLIQFKDLSVFQQPNPGKGPQQVLESLTYCQPEHAPFFYLSAYFWAKTFGWPPESMRALPAVFSLLQIPCMYWLAMEIFMAPLAAEFAAALIALSPLQLLYAHEVREYSLVTAIIALTSAAFLRALRKPSLPNWGLYLATLIFGFYTSVLTALAVLAQFFYLIAISGLKWSRTATLFVSVSAIAAVSFTPWLIEMVKNHLAVLGAISWLATPVSVWELAGSWLDIFPKILLDLGDNATAITNCLTAFVLPLQVYALYVILRKGKNERSFLIATLFLVPALTFPLWDLILGGQRSMHMNYMMPIPVAVLLSIAFLLYRSESSGPENLRKIWLVLASLVFSCEIASCAIMSQSIDWPGLAIEKQSLPAIAQVLNADERAVLVTERGASITNFTQALALSHIVKPDVYFEYFDTPSLPNLPDKVDHFYLFNPTQAFVDLLTARGYTTAPAKHLKYLLRVQIPTLGRKS